VNVREVCGPPVADEADDEALTIRRRSTVSARLLGDIPLIRVRAGARERAHEAPPSMPLLGFVCGAALSLGLWIVLGWIACRLLV